MAITINHKAQFNYSKNILCDSLFSSNYQTSLLFIFRSIYISDTQKAM